MNEKILVIHPGCTRTGTRTFQHLLKFWNVNILAKPTENQTRTIWFKLFKEHLFKNKYEVKKKEYNYYRLRNDFKYYLKSFFNNQKRISVFSDEGLLGQLGDPRGIYNLYIFKEIIEEIEKELNIKIIIKFVITIRKQHSMILSIYHQGKADLLSQEDYGESYSEHMSIEDFFKRIIQSEDYRNLFDHTLLVKRINKIFNSEILILPLELLRKDKEKYIDKLCKFIGLEVNSKVNIEDKLIHLNKNRIIKDGRKRYFLLTTPRFTQIYYLASVIHNWLKKIEIYKKNFENNTLLKIIYQIIIPKEKKILVEGNLDLFQNEINNLYKDSNLKLEKMTNINLKELGYY